MNRPIETFREDKNHSLLNDIVKLNHYLFTGKNMNPINFDKKFHDFGEVRIWIDFVEVEKDIVLTRLELNNHSKFPFHSKIFVENYIENEEMNYAFISPKRDLLFLANDQGLYLTSGQINNSPINQYSIVKTNLLRTYRTEFIPFCPIGNGEVSSVYSLEKVLKPNESAVAYSWVLFADTSSEKELIKWNNHLKSRLAFLEK